MLRELLSMRGSVILIYNEEEERAYLDYDNEEEMKTFDKVQEKIHSYTEEFDGSKMCAGLECTGISCRQCPVGHVRRTLYNLEAYLKKIRMG